MRLINVFSTATFFYCIATAWATQPDKVKLYGVSRNAAAAASRTPQGHMKSLPAPIKTRTIKVKKDSDDPDRRLTQKGSIRGEQMDDHVQRKRSLEDAQVYCQFSANGDLSFCCVGTVDYGILCYVVDSPAEGLDTVFLNCPSPPSIQLSECQSCAIYVVGVDDAIDPENDPQCQSCSICVDAVDNNGTVAYDCSNLPEGESVGAGDCSGSSTTPATPTPTPPSDGSSTAPPTPTPTPPSDGSSTTPPTLTPTPPSDGSSTVPPTPTPTEGRVDETSTAFLRALSILSISATTIAAFGLF